MIFVSFVLVDLFRSVGGTESLYITFHVLTNVFIYFPTFSCHLAIISQIFHWCPLD